MCIMFLQNAGSLSKGFCKTRVRSRRSSDMAEQQGWGYYRAGAGKACGVCRVSFFFHLSALFVCLLPTVPRASNCKLAAAAAASATTKALTLNPTPKPWSFGWAHINFFRSQGWETLPVCRLRFEAGCQCNRGFIEGRRREEGKAERGDRCACQIFVLKSPQCLHFCSEGLTGLSTSELES